VSVRLPTDDLGWLSTHDMPGAVTPSDKLRTLVTVYRRQQEGLSDLAATMAWMRELVSPILTKVVSAEHRLGAHSEIVRLAGEWVPQMMAAILADQSGASVTQKNLIQLEERLAARMAQLITATLRLLVTESADAYDPRVLDKHLPAIIELLGVISASRRVVNTKES